LRPLGLTGQLQTNTKQSTQKNFLKSIYRITIHLILYEFHRKKMDFLYVYNRKVHIF
jgi:hypothetical protein